MFSNIVLVLGLSCDSGALVFNVAYQIIISRKEFGGWKVLCYCYYLKNSGQQYTFGYPKSS